MSYENSERSINSPPKAATVLVRGEVVGDQAPNVASKVATPAKQERATSEVNVRLQTRLPALDDDSDIGVPKDHLVTRDGKADLAFNGKLLASVAPRAAPAGTWQEYRVYITTGGKHVFSKVTRSVLADAQDKHESEVFDPSPTSMPSQLLKGARDLTRSKPLTWTDAAAAFFGYDPLAKSLYQKLSGEFEEHIT